MGPGEKPKEKHQSRKTDETADVLEQVERAKSAIAEFGRRYFLALRRENEVLKDEARESS